MGVLRFVFPHDVVVSELERRRLSIVPAKGDKGDTGDDGYTPVRGVDYWTAADVEAMEVDVTERLLAVLAPLATVNGALVSVDDALAIPAETLNADIDVTQSGSGTPAPDNVRPITGWTSVTVRRTGANLAGAFTSGTTSGVTFTANADGTVSLSGTATAAVVKRSAMFAVTPGKTYYIGGCPVGGGYDSWRLDVRDANGGLVSGAPIDSGAGGGTWTVPSGVTSICLAIRIASGAVCTGVTFRPVAADNAGAATVTMALGRTVYGGTLDVVSGTLTVTHAGFTASSASAADSTGKVFNIGSKSDAVTASGSAAAAIVCDRFGVYTLGGLRGDSVTDGIAQNQTTFYVKRSGCTTLADTNTWLAENPVTVVYPLATPVTYQLTGAELSTLRGSNTVFANTGDISLTYRQDANKAMQREIDELRALVLENIGD